MTPYFFFFDGFGGVPNTGIEGVPGVPPWGFFDGFSDSDAPPPSDVVPDGWPFHRPKKPHKIEEVPDIVEYVEERAAVVLRSMDTSKLQKQILRGRYGDDIVLPPQIKKQDDDDDELIELGIL